MGRTFSGTAQYLSRASALVAAMPYTYACWWQSSVGNVDQVIMGQGDSTSSGAPTAQLILLSADHTLRAELAGSVDDNSAATAATAIGTWYHGAAVFASTTSRAAYLNGVKGSSAVSVTPTGSMNVTRIANIPLNLSGFMLHGQVAFPAIWNVALTDPEIAALAQGVSPKLIRPQALVAYARLSGSASPEPDFIAGTWTLTGTPTFSANPRLFGP